MMTSVIAEVRALDSTVTRWEARGPAAREAATTAMLAVDLLIVKLERLRDQLRREQVKYEAP